MTREEQIRQASIEYTYKDRPMCIGGGTFSEIIDEMNRNYAFEAGAKWADKTTIDKACEWLQNWASLSVNDTTDSLDEEDLVKRFKKAMEE